MRRFLHGGILFSWVAFLVSVTVGGVGAGNGGLLQELHTVLTGFPLLGLGFETARAILTGFVVATLSVALWSLMITVTSDDEEYRERFMALGAGFGFVLVVVSLWLIVCAIAGAGGAAGMLFAIQAATLLSMLAAGGVEFAWEVRSLASTPENEEDSLAERIRSQLAASSAGLAAMKAMAREEGEKI